VVAHVNRIGTALPPFDVHEAFTQSVAGLIEDEREARLFRRMVSRAGIAHRWSFLEPGDGPSGFLPDKQGFYTPGAFPSTGARMAQYEAFAPGFATQAIDAMGLRADERAGITHLIVASCTGFTAPGLDQLIARHIALDPSVERTMVGFMGCYAAVNALRLAHHTVRSEPTARVLVVNLELCTLHFQQTPELDRILSMLIFGDGCTAALVSAEPVGLALHDFRSSTIDDSADAITWRIGDQGFDMHLSREVPIRIQRALAHTVQQRAVNGLLRGTHPDEYALWAVHAGGRSILDAVEDGLALPASALAASRAVLRDCGNMSSATLMFVLARMLESMRAGETPRGAQGMAMAFGPGLAAETFRFATV
jgi:predicted naringenin-chalcone synthase